MRSAGVTLQRSNPQEARRASRGTCVDFLVEEGISTEEATVRPVSSGILPYLVPREDSFLAVSPSILRLGLSGIPAAQLTGLAKDRSMRTLVPTGLTVAPGPMMGTPWRVDAREAS